jgi:serine hydrolase
MVILVHGYDGSGPEHWQRWLAVELEARAVPVRFPELPDPTAPKKDAWVAALAAVTSATGAAPLTFVCHSLGCWALDHLLAEGAPSGEHAALLVAPPSPFLLFEPVESFLPPPRQRHTWASLAARSLLVGSDNDELTSAEEFSGMAADLGVRCHIIPGAGHINTASGYGPWPWALDWVLRAEGMD